MALVAAVACGLTTWGFYAHREINRLAVYTLPAGMAAFYKANIEYLSAHAVDPDKRRYAATLEGPRHFVDMERFGDGSMDALPREFWEFHSRYTALYCSNGSDSTRWAYDPGREVLTVGEQETVVDTATYRGWYEYSILPMYYREETRYSGVLPEGVRVRCTRLSLVDTMTQHGVLPYHLVSMQRRLTAALRQNDAARALQLSAEIGHYIGDATVPLHTTENYNGQLTGQRGIHAFWESRLPELFAEEEYDVLVGGAVYIEDPTSFYRDIISSSHELVDSVLLIEADLRRKLPEDIQECYEERLGRIVRVPCRAFAAAYQERLDGMVEERFRRAIRAVGSAWFTAWTDAGKPKLDKRGQLVDAPRDTFVVRRGLGGRGH